MAKKTKPATVSNHNIHEVLARKIIESQGQDFEKWQDEVITNEFINFVNKKGSYSKWRADFLREMYLELIVENENMSVHNITGTRENEIKKQNDQEKSVKKTVQKQAAQADVSIPEPEKNESTHEEKESAISSVSNSANENQEQYL